MNAVTTQELIKQINFIKDQAKPKTKDEYKVIEYIDSLLTNELSHMQFVSAKDWSDHIDLDMQCTFENEIVEENNVSSLQDVFSDNMYSAVQEIRDAYQNILRE